MCVHCVCVCVCVCVTRSSGKEVNTNVMKILGKIQSGYIEHSSHNEGRSTTRWIIAVC